MSWPKFNTVNDRMDYILKYANYSIDEIKDILDIYTDEEIINGYTVYMDAGEVPGALSIGMIPQLVGPYDLESDAVEDYEMEGGKIIRDIPTDMYYIDTPENRRLIEEYMDSPKHFVTLSEALKSDFMKKEIRRKEIPHARQLHNVKCGNGKLVWIGLGEGCFVSPNYVKPDQLTHVEINTELEAPFLKDYLFTETHTGVFVYAYVPIEVANRFFYENGGIESVIR